MRDYLLLIVFTGLRRQEAAKLRWEQVNLKSKTLTITDTKNREVHTLPLSDYLFELLQRRKKTSMSEYVFSWTGSSGYIIEPRKQMAKVIATSDVSFTVHDLRCTFITIAESLDIPAYALKRLLNHKINTISPPLISSRTLSVCVNRCSKSAITYQGVWVWLSQWT